LERLAAGRAEVILRDGEEREPEPTVEVSPMFGFSVAWQAIPEAGSDSDGRPSDSRGGPVPRPRRRLFTARPSGASANGGTTTVAYKSTSARRADVTLPVAREHATLDATALANATDTDWVGSGQANGQPGGDVLVPSQTSTMTEEPDVGSGNIALIIDSTTDMSMRAMQKVRSTPPAGPPAQQVAPEETVLTTEPQAETVIGGELVRARATLGLTVDELAERTRIRPSVIESIEVDDFAPCGGDFYAKGHLRMLARVLGIDAAPLVAAYDDHFAASPINARDVFEVELATRARGSVKDDARGRRGALIGTVVLLMLVWGAAAYFAGDDPASTSQSVAPTQLGPTFKQTGLTPPTPRTAEPRDNGGGRAQAQVMVSASGGSSRVVVMDGSRTVMFRGVLSDGAGQKFSGEAPLRVRAADGGVISLSVRGKYLGYVGVAGLPGHQIVRASPAPDRR
jgi:ribosome-binding protein aMBF1 (putative translation factor)